MAAPSQPFPPWLTPLPTVVTDAAGIPTTSTTVLYLPLTYYGPSIPLNSDWTYGGLTSPASTPVTTTPAIPPSSITSPTLTSESITLTTTSAISPTLTSSSLTLTPSTSSSTAISSSTSSSSSISLSSSASFTSPSSTSTASSTPTSASSSGLSRGQLIGVIVASILGAVFLFILVLALYLGCKGRKKRQRDVSFSIVTPIDEDYLIVGQEGRILGEGSPRHSGEEADPFLQKSGAAASGSKAAATDSGARAGPSRVPVPAPPGSRSSKGSSSTNHSGYGVLIDRPTLNLMPSTTAELDQLRRGHILSAEELRRINEEEEMVLPADNGRGRYSPPLPPPPRLVDPARSQTPPLERPLPKPETSHLSQVTTAADTDEHATVAIARHVRVETHTSRSPPRLPSSLADASSTTHSGFLAGLGAGLASIGRLSWLKSLDSHSRRNSRAAYLATPHEDIEAAKSLLHPQMSESTSTRAKSFGKTSDRTRPLSASSGGTVYHDAHSSLPGTPIPRAANLAPLPRALTPSGPTAQEHGWLPRKSKSSSQPPSYDPFETTTSTSASVFNHGLPAGQDILDLPAPSAVLPFTSATASTSTLSLREKDITNSLVLKTHSFPPGLDLVEQKKSWTDASSGVSQVHAPFGVVSNHPAQRDISVDVLEEAPPVAEEGWRSMAAVIHDGPGRRTTFGYIPGPDIVSEQGSLYSMHSPLNPASIRSDTSAALSRHDQEYSIGSASSRPSALSAAHTTGSRKSLAASRSISSDERKQGQAVSPTLSAFGPISGEPEMSVPSRPQTAYLNGGTVRSVGSGTTAVDTLAGTELITTTATEPPGSPTSPSLQFSNAPWAAGLDQDWSPTET